DAVPVRPAELRPVVAACRQRDRREQRGRENDSSRHVRTPVTGRGDIPGGVIAVRPPGGCHIPVTKWRALSCPPWQFRFPATDDGSAGAGTMKDRDQFRSEPLRLTRRYFLRAGAAALTAAGASPFSAGAEPPPELAQALDKLESYFTPPAEFQDVSRGKPLPH